MPIILDPQKSVLTIEIFYVEEMRRHGNSVFHFMHDKEEFEKWKNKGYFTEDEARAASMSTQSEQTKQADPNKIIRKLVTVWQQMRWVDQNTIFSRSMKTSTGSDGKTITELDTIKYRDLRLKTCLKNWDLKDEAGNAIPMTDSIVDNLDPSVAQELLVSFEKVTEAEDETESK